MAPIFFSIFRFYWWLFRPVEYGVKVIVQKDNQILAIRNSYGWKRWTFPGGKINKGENPIDAAKREVNEETGINVSSLIKIGEFESRAEYKQDNIFVFIAETDTKDFKIDPFEIEEARWFQENNLPEFGPIARKIIDIYEQHKSGKN